MAEISATEAARNFADVLDAVEHRGERFTIVRRGTVVAQLGPVGAGKGRDVKAMLRRHTPDGRFPEDIASVRRMLVVEDRT